MPTRSMVANYRFDRSPDWYVNQRRSTTWIYVGVLPACLYDVTDQIFWRCGFPHAVHPVSTVEWAALSGEKPG